MEMKDISAKLWVKKGKESMIYTTRLDISISAGIHPRNAEFDYPAARTSFQLTIATFISAAHVHGSSVSGFEL